MSDPRERRTAGPTDEELMAVGRWGIRWRLLRGLGLPCMFLGSALTLIVLKLAGVLT